MKLILAGTYEQAREYAQRNRGPWKFVAVPSDLLGHRGEALYVVGTAYERIDYGDIIADASLRGWEVVHAH